MPTTYENQVEENKAFWGIRNQPEGFLRELIGENWPTSIQAAEESKSYDITGFNSRRVVALLSHIVNSGIWKTNKTFYFLIRSNDAEEDFRLQARPTVDQPGNGTFYYRPNGYKKFNSKAYDELCGAVEAFYGNNTTRFARDIKQLFQDNGNIHDVPPATAEAYILLLFEIARRLVRKRIESEKKRELDKLPIGSAIARALNLLLRDAISFKQFFFDTGYFHCFARTPQERRSAIENINNRHATCFPKGEPVSKENCRAELQATFVKRTNEEDKLEKEEDKSEEEEGKSEEEEDKSEEEEDKSEELRGALAEPEAGQEAQSKHMIPKEERVTKRLMEIGQFLLLNRADFCQWLTDTGTAKNPEHQEDYYNRLMCWWRRDIPPLNNRCNPLSTKVHRKFVNERMGEKPVTALAGIGPKNGEKLSAAGFKKAKQVLGVFLVMKKNEQGFKEWLKDTCEARSNHQNDCFDCLKQWCDNFL